MKEGWEYIRLKEVGRTQTGSTPSKANKDFYGGDVPFIRPAELNVDGNGAIEYNSELKLTTAGAENARLIKANSTLMCCIGSVGKTGYSSKDVTCNQQINTITPYDGYDGKYIYYALLSPEFQSEVIKIANSAKATLAIISKGKWENLSIPVPSLSEQQSIVDYLDSSFAKIDAMKVNAEKALGEAKALFQAAIDSMITNKDGWKETTLGEIATEMYRGSGIKRDQVVESGFPCLRYGEIYTTYNFAFDKCVSHTTQSLIKTPKYFEKGDLLFAITGESVEDIGKCIAYLGEEKCMLGGDIIAMKHNQNPKFLAYALSTSTAIKQKGLGKVKLKVVHTNAPSLKAITLFLPSLNEQQEIVSLLDSLSDNLKKQEVNYTKMVDECNSLKQAILKQVFE